MTKKLILGLTMCFALWVSIALLFSCNKGEAGTHSASSEQLRTMSTTVPNAIIGYINDDKQFVPISEQQLETFFQKIDFLSTDGNLEEYGVIEGSDSANNKLYAVRSLATDGEYFTKMTFQLEAIGNNRYALMSGGCSCKSIGCSTWGCNVSDFGPCSCSDCGADEGECEKTSTRLTKVAISSLFI